LEDAHVAFRRIAAVVPLPNFKLQLTFDDGVSTIVDFGPKLKLGGVYERLADPKVFASPSVLCGGRVLAWDTELEFDADGLWLEGLR
jgi:hypothetical protein